jgi:hypothetical protein
MIEQLKTPIEGYGSCYVSFKPFYAELTSEQVDYIRSSFTLHRLLSREQQNYLEAIRNRTFSQIEGDLDYFRSRLDDARESGCKIKCLSMLVPTLTAASVALTVLFGGVYVTFGNTDAAMRIMSIAFIALSVAVAVSVSCVACGAFEYMDAHDTFSRIEDYDINNECMGLNLCMKMPIASCYVPTVAFARTDKLKHKVKLLEAELEERKIVASQFYTSAQGALRRGVFEAMAKSLYNIKREKQQQILRLVQELHLLPIHEQEPHLKIALHERKSIPIDMDACMGVLQKLDPVELHKSVGVYDPILMQILQNLNEAEANPDLLNYTIHIPSQTFESGLEIV